MKKVLLSSVVALAASTGVAFANVTAEKSLKLKATVEQECVLGSVTATSNSATVTADTSGSIDEYEFALEDGITFTFGDSYCNFAHKVKLTSANGGLKYVGTPPVSGTAGTSDPFDTFVMYKAKLTNWSAEPTLTTDGSTGGNAVTSDEVKATRNDANGVGDDKWDENSPLTLTIDRVSGPTEAFLQGSYSDTLTLTIGSGL